MLIPRALPARAHTFALETCRDVLAKLEWEIQGLDDEQEMPALAFRPFNCAVTAWHLADWIWKALGPRRRTWGGDEEAFRHACRDLCPALKHCWLIANASKHGGLDLHKRKQISTEIRSEKFQPPWIGQAQVTALALSRLDRRDGAVLVERAAGKSMADELLAQIVERTDGVPLFVEELTKTVLESGLLREHEGRWVLDGPLPALAIPATGDPGDLAPSLIARLDRLSAVKEVT